MPHRYKHVAEFYDHEYAHRKMLQEDVPFFLRQLPRRRQRILELAVGTGRAAIPLAQAGHQVVGVDYARDMLAIARQKRDAVGLNHRDLRLELKNVLGLQLRQRFDWVCFFFNTFLAFPELAQQDQLLQVIRRHMRPDGHFWLDIFNPDVGMIAHPRLDGLEPHSFFVPGTGRTVFMSTSIRRTGPAAEHVTFTYRWFDEFGREHRDKTEFDLTFIFPRELQILLERNGLRIERIWGDYDGSPLRYSSPRIIARCARQG